MRPIYRRSRKALAQVLRLLATWIGELADQRIDCCIDCGRNPWTTPGCQQFNYYGTPKSRHAFGTRSAA